MPDNSVAGTAETMTVEDRVGMSTVARWEAECESTGMAHRWASATPHGWVCVSCGIKYDRRPSADDYRAAYRATYAALAERTAECERLAAMNMENARQLSDVCVRLNEARASLTTAQEALREIASVHCPAECDDIARKALAARPPATPEGTDNA